MTLIYFKPLNTKIMRVNKYSYYRVIQQNYGQGWEDVSHYETKSNFISFDKSGVFKVNKCGKEYEVSLLQYDLNEYRFLGYATRVVNRKELND